jgi:hypothetical protein
MYSNSYHLCAMSELLGERHFPILPFANSIPYRNSQPLELELFIVIICHFIMAILYFRTYFPTLLTLNFNPCSKSHFMLKKKKKGVKNKNPF